MTQNQNDKGWFSHVVAPLSKLPNFSINWHRTAIPPEVSKKLHLLSDWEGMKQAGGWLGLLLFQGFLALYSSLNWSWYITVFFCCLYASHANFSINAMHELGHGNVFKTKELSIIFLRICSFLGWHHPDLFFASHLRHHRYTLNTPWDLENGYTPIRITFIMFVETATINIRGFYYIVRTTVRAALGNFPTGHLGWLPEWEEKLFPEDQIAIRIPAIRWARFMLFGHALVFLVSIYFRLWVAPLIINLGPFYCGGLFFLCNATQHVGLQVGTRDFRLCCRSIQIPKFVAFFYWHMQWHIEHHMYSAVPCYRLSELNAAIQHELPKAQTLLPLWMEIRNIVDAQSKDPTWEVDVKLPKGTALLEPKSKFN